MADAVIDLAFRFGFQLMSTNQVLESVWRICAILTLTADDTFNRLAP